MTKAKICEVTVEYGQQRWRRNSNGNWSVLMFGTFGPSDHGIPRYEWKYIPTDKVPKEVITTGENR